MGIQSWHQCHFCQFYAFVKISNAKGTTDCWLSCSIYRLDICVTIRVFCEYFCEYNIFTARNSSCRKVMFLHLSVILFTGGVWADTTPSWPDPPLGRHPSGRHPPGRHSPDGHCSGRYASYWNAFLFVHNIPLPQ